MMLGIKAVYFFYIRNSCSFFFFFFSEKDLFFPHIFWIDLSFYGTALEMLISVLGKTDYLKQVSFDSDSYGLHFVLLLIAVHGLAQLYLLQT